MEERLLRLTRQNKQLEQEAMYAKQTSGEWSVSYNKDQQGKDKNRIAQFHTDPTPTGYQLLHLNTVERLVNPIATFQALKAIKKI